MEIAKGPNSEGTGSGIGGNFVSWDPASAGNSPDEKGGTTRSAFIGLGHELAHKEDRWKGALNTGTGYSAPTPSGGTASVSNAELYATHVENQLRNEFLLPLRTHYSPDASGGVYEPSRIIKAGSVQRIYYDNSGKTTFTPLGKKATPYKYR